MKKTLYALIITGLLFASCSKDPQPLTKEQMRYKIDSLTKVQVNESNEHAKRDLEHRIKIEVKVKVDSILNARMHLKIKDTTQQKKLPGRPLFK